MSPFLQKDPDDNWNTVPPVSADEMRHINCHKFVLYCLGRLSWEELVADSPSDEGNDFDFTFGKKVQSISDDPFTLVTDATTLYNLANKNCELGKTYVGQVLDNETGEMAHSFILEKNSDNSYTCFDKQGFKYSFSVHELGDLLDFVNKDGVKSYQNQKWRFVEIKK